MRENRIDQNNEIEDEDNGRRDVEGYEGGIII